MSESSSYIIFVKQMNTVGGPNFNGFKTYLE